MAVGDLITRADVLLFLQVNPDDTEQHGIIDALIAQASAAVTQYAEREFYATGTATRDFNYRGAGRLELAPYDLRSVTSATIIDSSGTSTLLAVDTDYRLLSYPVQTGTYTSLELADRHVGRYGTWTARRVRIVGTWGFAAVPADVKLATVLYVKNLLRDDIQAFGSSLQPNSFGVDVNASNAFPPAIRGLLDPYRRPAII